MPAEGVCADKEHESNRSAGISSALCNTVKLKL